MADRPQGRTRYDELVEEIGRMIDRRVGEAVGPLLRRIEELERRGADPGRRAPPGAADEPEAVPLTPPPVPEA